MELFIDLVSFEARSKYVIVWDLVELAHDFGSVIADGLDILCGLPMLRCLTLIKWSEVQHVPVEGALNELADGLTVDELVFKVHPIDVVIKGQVFLVESLLDFVWCD